MTNVTSRGAVTNFLPPSMRTPLLLEHRADKHQEFLGTLKSVFSVFSTALVPLNSVETTSLLSILVLAACGCFKLRYTITVARLILFSACSCAALTVFVHEHHELNWLEKS